MASQNLNSVATATSITPASDYLIISKGGTAINKITAATALSNAFAGAAKNTSITATDQLMMATGGTTANRIDYNVLAKAIIENYASSSLAGKTQSVQNAFAALNSKCQFTYNTKIVKIALYSTSFTVFFYNDDAQQNGLSISAGQNFFSLYKIEAGNSSLMWNLHSNS